MIEICNKEKCTGCGICCVSCNLKAISMDYDDHGFLHPVINPDICINCSKCQKKCPQNDSSIGNHIDSVYAALSKNDITRAKSSSGGLFSELAKIVIKNGGVVYGAAWTNNFSVKHIRIENYSDIHLLQGSKYLQSNITNIIDDLKNDLDRGKKVLFSGTPCQIHALKNFLILDYDNLFTIDLLCHGVPSQKVFDKFINTKNGNDKNVTSINFREKKPTWESFGMSLTYSDNSSEIDNSFLYFFWGNYCLRSSCHNCKYSSEYRWSDITLGDFWGYKESAPEYIENDNLGISFVGINTQKGEYLFKKIKKYIDYAPRTINEAALHNTSLHHPEERNKSANLFWNLENGLTWDELSEYFNASPKERKNWLTDEQKEYYAIPYRKRHQLHLLRIKRKKYLAILKGLR